MSVTVIIPAYNEEKRIGNTLEEYLRYFDSSVKFFVVLNGCHDDTEGVVKHWQKKYSGRLDYVIIEEPGKGLAVRRGFEIVQDDIIGFTDADNSTTAEEFDKLLQKIGLTDVVIGSRYAPGASEVERVNLLRKVAGKLFHIVVRVITFLPFYDTQCGAKIFQKKVVDTIVPDLTVDDMAFDIEILLACQYHKFDIEEVPVAWSEGEASTSITARSILFKAIQMLSSVIRVRLRYLLRFN